MKIISASEQKIFFLPSEPVRARDCSSTEGVLCGAKYETRKATYDKQKTKMLK